MQNSFWPTLSVGSFVEVLASGRSRSRRALLVAVGPEGELNLALAPASPRSRWRPWLVTRQAAKAVFAVRRCDNWAPERDGEAGK